MFVIRHVCCYRPAADRTSMKQADDEFLMFDEDISVKAPPIISSLLQAFKGEKLFVVLCVILQHLARHTVFSHTHLGHCILHRHCPVLLLLTVISVLICSSINWSISDIKWCASEWRNAMLTL